MMSIVSACGGALELLRETFDTAACVFVGELVCEQCRAQYLDTRRPTQSRKAEPMAKRDGYPKSLGRKRPRQQDLIQDRAIKPLEDAAANYAELRDERMRLTEQESGLKAKLLSLMKKHGKTTYHHDGVSIEVVHDEETVKVRVKKAAEGGEALEDDEDTGEQAVDAEA